MIKLHLYSHRNSNKTSRWCQKFIKSSFIFPSIFLHSSFHYYSFTFSTVHWICSLDWILTSRHWKCVCVLLVQWTRIWEASILSLKCLEHWRRDQRIQSWDKDRREQQYERSTHISLTKRLTSGHWVAGKRS